MKSMGWLLVALLCAWGGAFAAPSVNIKTPTNGQVVEAGDKSIWLECEVNDFELGEGKGTLAVFVNGEYYKTTFETSTGLPNVEAGEAVIEVQLQDADQQEVAKNQIKIRTVVNEAEVHENTAEKITQRYVPQEGDTMPLGSLFLLSPTPNQIVEKGSPLPVRFRLKNVPNSQISAVHIIANDQQEVYVFEGQDEGEISLPLNDAGKLKITARLGGHPNHVAMEMQASTVVTIGDAHALQSERDTNFIVDIVESERMGDGNLIMAAAGDEPVSWYETFLASLRHTGAESAVVIFAPISIPSAVRDLASKYGATLVIYNPDFAPPACSETKTGGVGCYKYFLMRRYLEENPYLRDQGPIFISDIDSLFQSNIFTDDSLSLSPASLSLFAISRQLNIEDDDNFSHYLFDQCELYDGHTLNQVGSKQALWDTVMFGPFDAVYDHLEKVSDEILKSASTRCIKFADIPAREFVSVCHHQGVHNALAYRLDPAANIFYSENGPIFVTHKWPSLRLNKNYQVLLPGEESAEKISPVVIGAHNFPDLVAALSGENLSVLPDNSGIFVVKRS